MYRCGIGVSEFEESSDLFVLGASLGDVSIMKSAKESSENKMFGRNFVGWCYCRGIYELSGRRNTSVGLSIANTQGSIPIRYQSVCEIDGLSVDRTEDGMEEEYIGESVCQSWRITFFKTPFKQDSNRLQRK